jgi:integrase
MMSEENATPHNACPQSGRSILSIVAAGATVASLPALMRASGEFTPVQLRRFERAVGRLTSNIPEIAQLAPDDDQVLPLAKTLHHRKAGLTALALKANKSALRAAIRWYKGETNDIERHPAPPTGPWAPLHSGVLAMKLGMSFTERTSLTNFMRHCSLKGVVPTEMTAAILDAYMTGQDGKGQQKTLGQVQGAAKGWNIARSKVSGWPDIVLIVPSRARKSFLAADEHLSEEFKTGFKRYVEYMSGASAAVAPDADAEPFDLDAAKASARPGRPLKPSVVAGRTRIVRQAAGLLALATGTPISGIAFADLVVPKNMQRILNRYAAEIGKRKSYGLRNLMDGLRALATFVGVGPAVKEDIRTLRMLASPEKAGLTKKNMARLMALGGADIESLYQLPAMLLTRVLAKVSAGLPLKRSEVVDAEIAVAVAILLNIPLRGENLVALALGKQLYLADGDHRARIVIPAEDTKGNRELIFPVPPDLARLIRCYIEKIAPEVPKMQNRNVLFAGEKNETKGRGHLGTQISARIKRDLGLAMNPHLFRHLIACLYLARNPGQYEPVRLLLGHADVATTIRFYASLATATTLQHAMRQLGRWKVDAGLDPDDMSKRAA